MHDIPACVLLFFSVAALGTLLYTASVIDDDGDWFAFTGPFLFLYTFLMFLGCVSCSPLMLYYCTRNTEGKTARDDRLRNSATAAALATFFVAVAITFLALLSADIDAAIEGPGGASAVNWTAPFVIGAAGLLVLLVYGTVRLNLPETDTTLSVVSLWCTDPSSGTDREHGIPLCFGGTDALNGFQSPSAAWTRRYHVSLLVALSFVAVGFVAAAPTLNSGSNINAALWAFYLATFIAFASGLVVFIARLRAPAANTTRQTIMVGLATAFALFLFIFTIQLNETYSSAHVLFVTLYVAFAAVIVSTVILTADAESDFEERRAKVAGMVKGEVQGTAAELVAEAEGEVAANWEQL